MGNTYIRNLFMPKDLVTSHDFRGVRLNFKTKAARKLIVSIVRCFNDFSKLMSGKRKKRTFVERELETSYGIRIAANIHINNRKNFTEM